MHGILRTSQFKRDVKLAQKRGKDGGSLRAVIEALATGQSLPAIYRDHQLKGVFKDCRECHIEGDWLLIYRIEGRVLQLVRTGTHADLFR
ncbi:MAG: type II toxin-antitoxin system YafQ family toxin [Lentisphaerae bacterium]|nr:type II toxin-antitoxin system YafQ family toxin [Planctomycetota bacterium]MBM4144456.1 type II toxin-antitoxin system YafQ family toxin [Lentisphaerota bacterium]